MNATVQALLTSINIESWSPVEINYFWDHINLEARFLILKQTNITTSLGYNVDLQLLSNETNLNWLMLPDGVQSFLLRQQSSSLFNLTYAKWSWVDSSSQFANVTLYSQLTLAQCNQLTTVLNVLEPLTYDSKIVNAFTIVNSLNELFGLFFSLIKELFPLVGKPPVGPYSRVSNALNTFYNSVYNGQHFVWTYKQNRIF